MGFLGVLPISGVSKERVTLWSGCIGLTALAGFSGQRPEWDGAKPSPSGEPTTTKAKRVVIVGYIKGKPLSVHHSLWLPLSCRQGGFQSLLPIGLAPTNTRSKSSISFCRTGFFSIIRWRIFSASTKWLDVHISLPSCIW